MAMHPPAPTVVTVVHAPACHFCEDAMEALAAMGHDFPLAVELIDATDPRGVALAREHRAPMYPLILLDGTFFSFGRLPRNKLRRALEARAAVA